VDGFSSSGDEIEPLEKAQHECKVNSEKLTETH